MESFSFNFLISFCYYQCMIVYSIMSDAGKTMCGLCCTFRKVYTTRSVGEKVAMVFGHTTVTGHILVPYRQIPRHAMAMELTEEQELQIFVKQMLKKRIFLGHYQERRYVESLGSYRDVVVITTSEHDLKKDLSTVKRKLMSFNKFSNLWVGITGPDTIGAPARYAVWVRLQNLAFGHYWFQVRQVKFVDGREMILSLKCIGPVDVDSMNMKVSESESDQEKHPEAPEPAPANSDTIFNYNEMKQKVRGSVKEMTTDFASVMTMHNIRQVFCFTSVFIVALITGLIRSIGYVGDYSIKFMREISFFIHACTPIIIAIIEVFGKCVGGFYLLIAMLWRGSYVKPPYTNSRHQQRSLQMPHHMQYHNN